MKEGTSKAGMLYGLGVGPGDPELMTLKAVRLIEECDVVAIPKSGQDINAAYTIAAGAVKNIGEKPLLEVEMPMIRDKKKLEESHDAAAAQVMDCLREGKNIAFLTLGDPAIYSTYIYIHERVLEAGYQAQIVPGIPSFCAVAARLNVGLTEANKALHVIPASYDGLAKALELPGTKVLMKSGKSIGSIKRQLMDMEEDHTVEMVERCGMEGERVFRCAGDIDENAGYFSLLVVKEK